VPSSKAAPTATRRNHETLKPSFTPPYYDVTSHFPLHQRNVTRTQKADKLKC
jgi:hypothetical protein